MQIYRVTCQPFFAAGHDKTMLLLSHYPHRYGFPGKTNRSWGWLGGNSGDEELPWEDEDEEEEEEGEEEGVSVAIGGEGQVARQVVTLKSWQDLRALVEEGGTMVFVSSRSCRACKYLTP